MTTIKGFIRSTGAVVRRIEREQQRAARDATRRFKEQQKGIALENAQQAFANWARYIEVLQSIHKDCTEPINWTRICNQSQPREPQQETKYESAARIVLTQYKPNIIDKLFGFTKRKINKLESRVRNAAERDKIEYQQAFQKYKGDFTNWKELRDIAIGVDGLDPEAYRKALQYFQPFNEIKELGSEVSFSFNATLVDVDLRINSKDVIPDYELNLTSTGKLSRKNMPKSRFNELYQDHVCSSVLRVAREVFAYLPVEYARINAISDLLNTKTGHLEAKPVLSVIIPPATLMNLNFQSIDPSDCMENFVHNMNFKKTVGFCEVDKVELH